jgi:hypothetical protein
MQFVDSDFWLRGAVIAWSVPLPFCPVCAPRILEDLPGPETIH